MKEYSLKDNHYSDSIDLLEYVKGVKVKKKISKCCQFSDYYDFREYIENIMNGDILEYNIDKLKDAVYVMYLYKAISFFECNYLNKLIDSL